MSTAVPSTDTQKSPSHSSYSEYRDSGVDWLGTVPRHWETVPFRYYCDIPKGKVDPESDEHSDRVLIAPNHVEQDTGRMLELETAHSQGASSAKYLVEEGDLIYSKIRPALNKVCLARGDWLCSADMYPIRIRKGYEARYLKYLMLSQAFKHLMVNDSMRVAMPKVNRDTLNAARILRPPLDEQRAITDYLDRETERIGALIEKKEQLIDLLEEKRTALISRVVTQGLDRDVEMQDSGVEWLGEIPEGWEMTKLKFLAGEIIDAEHKTPPFHSDGDYLVVRTSNIRNGKLKYDDAKYTNRDGFEEWTQRGVPQPGDILFTREAPAGEACVVPDGVDLCLGQRVVLIRPNTEVLNNRFCMYSLYGRVTDEYVSVRSQGSTVDHFNMSDIYNIPIPHPSLDEQRDIIKYIDDRRAKIDGLIKVVERGVERLKEYQTALISAAVTGRIDVREESRMPEVKEANTWGRMILTLELIRRMRSAQHQSLGRTLLVKMLYLIQHHVRVAGMGFNFKRKDYGPYASELRYKVESALQDQGWIQVSGNGEQVQYELLEKADDETVQAYFESSWGDVGDQIDEIVSYFHQFDAERAEIVATLYAAWNDLKILGRPHEEEAIIREVRENWHPRKQETDESRWRKALHWMEDEGLVPTGFGEPTIEDEG